jgi:hypothetical protein
MVTAFYVTGTSKNRLFFSAPLQFFTPRVAKHTFLSEKLLKTSVFRSFRYLLIFETACRGGFFRRARHGE